ncbi:substrate-binding domain-containing protein [Tessaracoccus caeni]|uniref:substrate-binding domain-containing protein n=1 Tax=Tessaracoccus caeni TaxID=3031239 RepID=UPI0023D9D596|nr:sugar-binding protein [Tessaracoccus caeni]MDF1487553.1 sugar ABC transporter substrate-binding protein [Tessaracoccus caeni]
MKSKLAKVAIGLVVASLSLTACGGGRGSETTDPGNTTDPGATSTGGGGGEGFAADATIGVALPWLGTQNWAEADTMFKAKLEEAGFKAVVQAADNKVPSQQQQIESMVEQGAKVIVVGPIDGTQLGSVLETAKAAGVYILGYDRMIENTEAVDGVIQFGSVRTGQLQGQSLLDGLATKGDGPYNIELFAGGPADPNAGLFFQGAMEVLQPKIDDGTLTVVSGQTDFTQAATQDWDNSKAQARMDSILAGNYEGKQLDGVLSPNDGIARAILTSNQQAGRDLPIVTGLDAENESVKWIADGRQYSTVAKPTDQLVGKTIELIQALQSTGTLPEPSEKADNGAKEVGIYQLDPLVVTKDNLKEAFANDPERLALIEG